MKILTIVIPSYNTADFINKRIVSFLDKRILNEIEILIINDGSTDNTEIFAKEWEKKFKKTVRVITKENAGHGSVINEGIRLAEGKYFKVVDGDDWVDTEGLVKLVQYLRNVDTDLIINSYNLVDESKKNKIKLKKFQGVEYEKEYELEEVINKFHFWPLHAWTVRTAILKDSNIQLTEKCYYDDFEFVIYPIVYVKNIVFLDYVVYEYLVGQQNQSVSNRNVLKNARMHFEIIKDSINYYANVKMNINEKKDKYISDNIMSLIKSHYNIYLRNCFEKRSYNQLMKFDDELKKYSSTFYRKTSEKYKYIKWLRKNSRFIFMIQALGLRFIKRIILR